MPDWGKMQFREYPARTWEELLPSAEGETRELVSALVRYSGSQRLTAEEVGLKNASMILG